MKKNNIKRLTIILIFFISPFVYSQRSDIEEIVDVYHKFEETVRSKDRLAHDSLYLHGNMPLNIVAKSNGPKVTFFGSDNWAASWSSSLELKITNIDVTVIGNIAYTTAEFEEFNGSNSVGYGEDLFVYIRTGSGWKLSTLNNTFVYTSDIRDYTNPFPINNTIESVLESLRSSINSKDRNAFLDLFVNQLTHFFSFQNTFDLDWNYNFHSAQAFINSVVNSQSSFELSMENSEILVHDQYMATVVSDYVISEDGNETEKGRQMITLTADINKGWLISSVINTITAGSTTDLGEETPLDSKYYLEQNYPNPFNPTTVINFSLPASEFVVLEVFDALGRSVETLVKENLQSGIYTINFNADRLASGVYYYTISAGKFRKSKKMILLR